MKHWPSKRIITIISVLKQGLTKKETTIYHTKLFLLKLIRVALGSVTL